MLGRPPSRSRSKRPQESFGHDSELGHTLGRSLLSTFLTTSSPIPLGSSLSWGPNLPEEFFQVMRGKWHPP